MSTLPILCIIGKRDCSEQFTVVFKTNILTFISNLGHDSIRECQKGKILQGT